MESLWGVPDQENLKPETTIDTSLPQSPLNSMSLELDWMNLAEDCQQLFPDINGLADDDDTVPPQPCEYGMPNTHPNKSSTPLPMESVSNDTLDTLMLNDFDLLCTATNNDNDVSSPTADIISIQDALLQDLQDNNFNNDIVSQAVIQSDLQIDTDSYELVTINMQSVELPPPEELSPEPSPGPSSSKPTRKNKRKSNSTVEAPPTKKKNLQDEKYLENRKKNNIASQRSRYNRKDQEKKMEQKCLELEKENEFLKIKIKNLEEVTAEVKKKLIDSIVKK